MVDRFNRKRPAKEALSKADNQYLTQKHFFPTLLSKQHSVITKTTKSLRNWPVLITTWDFTTKIKSYFKKHYWLIRMREMPSRARTTLFSGIN